MGQRAPARRLPADHPDRDPGGAARRPALAASASDRVRPRSRSRLLRASLRRQRDHDHRARRDSRGRDGVLPAGRVRRDAEPRRRRPAPGGDVAAADRREPDLDDRPRCRWSDSQRPGAGSRLLGERGHVRALRRAACTHPGFAAPGRSCREPRPLGRRRRRLSDRPSLASAADRARRLEHRHARRRGDQRRRGRAGEGRARRRQHRLRRPARRERARAHGRQLRLRPLRREARDRPRLLLRDRADGGRLRDRGARIDDLRRRSGGRDRILRQRRRGRLQRPLHPARRPGRAAGTRLRRDHVLELRHPRPRDDHRRLADRRSTVLAGCGERLRWSTSSAPSSRSSLAPRGHEPEEALA